MKLVLSYFLSVIFHIIFFLLLLIFHPIQIVCDAISGYNLRKKSVDLLNICLISIHRILFASIEFKGLEKIPTGVPLIILSNHQSMFDIPPIIWSFRKTHPKFVSKQELGKGVPSISMNLRRNNSALIDRKDKEQSLNEIIKLGKHIEKEKYSAVIFPEGTRSKDSKVKEFKPAGIITIMEHAPSALIIPFAVKGNGNFISKGYFPLTIGCKLVYTVLDPIDPTGKDPIKLIEDVRQQIIKTIAD
jgi:1-acyl-sn-glycerol-3-phosphate acyltransferase